jgi:cytochrome c peroxidase
MEIHGWGGTSSRGVMGKRRSMMPWDTKPGKAGENTGGGNGASSLGSASPGRAMMRQAPRSRATSKGAAVKARRSQRFLLPALTTLALGFGLGLAPAPAGDIDRDLTLILQQQGFTGDIESTLERRLGRPLDRRLADLGHLLWFDTITGLNDDNTCAGCHSPTNGFGDTQSISIGIENNGTVGPDRTGPRNQRRAPSAMNVAFYPNLMWNSRFASLSGDPFDNRAGFVFPQPEGKSLSYLPHLLDAQAFIPPTERNEGAGFTFPGDNHEMREEVLRRLNATPAYRDLFAASFADVHAGAPITFDHVGKALAEFEFTLTRANAPIDRFARGERSAMTDGQKRGALLFFGKAGCVRCHAVAGKSNEMFSDFEQHSIGMPQVCPDVTNATFDGPHANEDFGLEQVSGRAEDRYKFRTAPLRNLATQAAFGHNGAFTTIEAMVRHHLDPYTSSRRYSPAGLDADLCGATGPTEPVLGTVDPLLRSQARLTDQEIGWLVEFLRDGLLDPRARYATLKHLIPSEVPSGRPALVFEDPSPRSKPAGPFSSRSSPISRPPGRASSGT